MTVRSVARFGVTLAGLALASIAEAQPVYERIHTFREIAYPVTGRLAEAPDGVLYGAGTRVGGILKFVRQPDGTLAASTLFAFTDGSIPMSVIYASDGLLYGTTCSSLSNFGTIFQLSPAGTLTTLHTFLDQAPGCPDSLVEAADGNLYGTTANAWGSIFRISKAGVFVLLRTFEPFIGLGYRVRGPLIPAADGNLYGITEFGGVPEFPMMPYSSGTFFRIDPSGNLTTVHNFLTNELVQWPRRLRSAPTSPLTSSGSPQQAS
jgi:uncharacterized repeat protein (TIGR03803 family)